MDKNEIRDNKFIQANSKCTRFRGFHQQYTQNYKGKTCEYGLMQI